ncbi:MAG TPA: hypothetical protein PKD38_18180, partial [Nitrospira sp.]|nr:hypothetical protein [Nitrospira sp.]
NDNINVPEAADKITCIVEVHDSFPSLVFAARAIGDERRVVIQRQTRRLFESLSAMAGIRPPHDADEYQKRQHRENGA